MRNNILDIRNSSSLLSFYSSINKCRSSCLLLQRRHTFKRATALSVYPRSTNICRVFALRNSVLAKHRSAHLDDVGEVFWKLRSVRSSIPYDTQFVSLASFQEFPAGKSPKPQIAEALTFGVKSRSAF